MASLRVAGRWIWATLAFAGFTVSLAVNVSTFLGDDLIDREAVVQILLPGMFLVVLPLAFVAGSRLRTQEGRGYWNRLFQRHPPWVLGCVYALFVYAIFNLAVDFLASRGGVPSMVDDQPVLESHGRIVRQLSREEYAHHQALATRGFSGLWMLFYGIPLLYAAFERGEEKREAAGSR